MNQGENAKKSYIVDNTEKWLKSVPFGSVHCFLVFDLNSFHFLAYSGYFYSLFEHFIAYEMSYAYGIDSNMTMETFTASAARKELYRLMDKTAESHEPVKITGKRNNVVMISEEDWNAVSETIYLNSVPGLAEEILQRRDSEDVDFVKDEEIDW